MVLGITYNEFWEMNPHIINIYVEGRIKSEELRQKRENQFAWLQGMYMCEALTSTVGNMFKEKNSKPFEYPDKPLEFEDIQEHRLTEEEIELQRNLFWQQLHIMQSNFELSKQGE